MDITIYLNNSSGVTFQNVDVQLVPEGRTSPDSISPNGQRGFVLNIAYPSPILEFLSEHEEKLINARIVISSEEGEFKVIRLGNDKRSIQLRLE